MASIDFFRLHAKEFANLSDVEVQAQLTSAALFTENTQYDLSKLKSDAKRELATALYAAHLCWLNKYPGQGGAHRGVLLSEKNTNQERTYRPVAGSATWLGQSHYGLSFLNLYTVPPVPTILTAYGRF